MISKFKTYSVIMAVLWLFAAACTGYSDPENDPASSGDAPVAPADESSDEDNLTEEQGSNASSGDISSDASDTVGSSETGEETPSSASEPSGTEEVPASPVPSSEEVASSSLAGPCGDISFSASSTDIADGLPATFEPSGDDWQPIINKYFVVSDEGILAMMNADGSDVVSWDIGGDFEGVTVADPASKYIYIGVENPDGILEFDLSEERVTRTFDLTPWMTGAANAGLEALTFVPDNSNAEGGLFYAGHQGEGKVYVFELPIQSSDNSTTVTFVKKFTPVSGRTDLSGMDYNSEDDVIFLAYDTANKLTVITNDGAVVNEWALPQTDQEGFTQTENCDLFIAQDSGGIRHYEGNDTTVTATAQTLANLAGRLIVVQNNDGSYDWQQDIGNDLTPDVTGYQNVTGVSAWGFLNLTDEPGWTSLKTALDKVVNYFDLSMDNLLAEPSDFSNNLSCPNWTLLSWYLQKYPDNALEDKTANAYGSLLSARDTTYGDDSSMVIDGLINRVIQGRASLPGLIPWDIGLCVEAAGAMAELDSSFLDSADDALQLLSNYMENVFLPAYDADNTLAHADLSLAMPLFVLAASQNSFKYVPLIAALWTRLESLVDPSGIVTNGSDNDGPVQATAYALLALKQVESASAEWVHAYLESQIDSSNGAILNPSTNIETYEVEGEVLRALVYRSVLSGTAVIP